MRDSIVVLAVWWAAWTLADAYLIRFTPWSELAVLAACGVVVGIPLLRKRASKGREQLDDALDRI